MCLRERDERSKDGGEHRLSAWRKVPGRCLIAIFKGYQYLISPLFPPACRFIPTCSQYAIDAVGKHGVIRGGILAMWRILRCHPFSRGGYDPVK